MLYIQVIFPDQLHEILAFACNHALTSGKVALMYFQSFAESQRWISVSLRVWFRHVEDRPIAFPSRLLWV